MTAGQIREREHVEQAFQPAGWGDFPVARFRLRAGKPAEPAAWKGCATFLAERIWKLAYSDWFGDKHRMEVDDSDSRQNGLLSGFHSRGALPHLKRQGAAYFVTFRLAGTLPKEGLLKFKGEREAITRHALAAKRPLTWHEQEELFRWYASRVDKYLDAGHGDCWLRQREIANLVAGALRFHERARFDLQAWVVMPNHVHAVVHPRPGWTLSQILQSWKGFTAREANRLLNRTGHPFWQVESFDHMIRDEEDMHRCSCYTTMNPVTAGLCSKPDDWHWSSVSRATMT